MKMVVAAGFLLWIGSHAIALQPAPSLGDVRVSFNGGEPVVDTTATGQSFFANVASNAGPQRTEQLRFVSVYEVRATNTQARYAALGAKTNTVEEIGLVVADYLKREDELLQEAGQGALSQLGGIQAAGDTTFLAGNVRRTDGNFDAWIYAWKGGREIESTQPLRLAATYKITPPGTQSEEVAHFELVDRPTSNADASATMVAATVTRDSPDCYAPWVNQINFLGPLSLFQPQLRRALAITFGQCHTRTVRVHGQPMPLTGFFRTAGVRADGLDATASFPLWVGARCRETPTAAEQACVYKVRAGADALSLDTTFGGDGQVIIRAADPAVPLRYWDHAIDRQGRVLVTYGLGRTDGSYVPVLLRLRADGTLDSSFPGNGVHTIPTTGASANPRTITTDINGNIQVTGETYTATTVRPFAYFFSNTSVSPAAEAFTGQLVEYAFPGHPNSAFFSHVREADGTIVAVGTSYGAYPDVSTMRSLVVQLVGHPAAVPAIEYFNAGFGHHISVVNPVEIAKLDSGEFVGWARTGYFFNVYPVGTPGTVPIDRFFTTAFPPKSSHVFAADAAESAKIKQNPVWQFEGTVFGALLPAADGSCPLGTRRVSRVYNNGLTGAPNHRFADEDIVIGAALGAGGVLEGRGPEGAFYCTE